MVGWDGQGWRAKISVAAVAAGKKRKLACDEMMLVLVLDFILFFSGGELRVSPRTGHPMQ